MKRHKKCKGLLWGFLCAVWGFVCLFPIWVLFSGTFSNDSDNLTQVVFPTSFSNGVKKITEAISTIEIGRATIDTMIYTIVTVIGILIISSLAAYEFAFFRFPLKKLLFGLVMVSMMLPQVLYIIPLYRLIFGMGLADTVLGVSLPLMVAPLAVFIMMQFIEDLPVSFIESAKIDGAGHFRIYGQIVFPLTATNIKPISVTIANILSPNYWVDSRVKIAAMLLAMLPPLLIYVVFQRYVIEGVTASGVKG